MITQGFEFALAAFLLLWLTSCAATMPQQLDEGTFYKRDAQVDVNGTHFEGAGVAAFSQKYQLVFTPKGVTDLLMIRTCHREFTAEGIAPGWFGKGQFRYQYDPVAEVEDTRVCPMRMDAYESDKGRHSWVFLDFESPGYLVPAHLVCNGSESDVHGVGVCQAKVGTVQRIDFKEPMRWAPAEPECEPPKKVPGAFAYELSAAKGECLYLFDTQDGRLGRLTLIGYEGVLVRETK
jgi:hypothetical protein